MENRQDCVEEEAAMIILNAQEISKNYVGTEIFSDVTFEIQDNDRIGLVGRNGCGKSTIAKLIVGQDKPTTGSISLKKGTTVGYLSQIPVYEKYMLSRDVLYSAFENVQQIASRMKQIELSMGNCKPEELERLLTQYGKLQDEYTLLDGYEIDSKVMRVANGLKITHLLESTFQTLSGGEQTKICLGFILLKSPNLLLLDEPTNHLDISAVEWLENYLYEYEGAVLIISHDRYFLDQTVKKIFDLEDGELNVYHGNYSKFVVEKEKKLLDQFNAYQEQQSKIKKMKEAIKRLKEWANQANPPNEGLHRRAKNMERMLERMEKIKKPIIEAKKMGLELDAGERSGKDVVILKSVSKGFDERTLLKDIDIHVLFRDHTAIVGDNGTGKSTILKMILDSEKADSGTVKVGSNVKIGYLSQHLFTDNNKMTVLEAFRDQVIVTEGQARHILAKFLFFGPAVFQKVERLSGGERMRLRLAQLMYQDINLLILDEPTNHLDIDSREVLEEALEEFKGTILAVSHDRYLLNKLFEKTYWISNQKLRYFPGNYIWAREKLQEELNRETVDTVIRKPHLKPLISQKIKKVSVEEIISELENRLVNTENQINEIQMIMIKETVLEKLQVLQVELELLEHKRNKFYEELEKILN